MRALKFTGVALAAVITIIALFLFTVGIPSGLVTSFVQDRVERETGYRIVISGATRFGLWPSFHVTANDITVHDSRDRDTGNRLTLDSAQLDMPFASVLSGRPHITRLAIDHPVLYVPLLRDRIRQPTPISKSATSSGEKSNATTVDHVIVTEGAVVFANQQDRIENRIDAINAQFKLSGDRKIEITGDAHTAEQPLKFELNAIAPMPPLDRQTIAVQLMLDAPGLVKSSISAKADVRLNGSVVMINGLSGKIGDDEFNGWASADLASKPLLKLDLDFQRLNIGATRAPSSPESSQPWSSVPIDLHGLNYLDAQIRISAGDLAIGDAHFAPAAADANLAGGVLKAGFTRLGIYGGEADGELLIDAVTGDPSYTLRSDLHDVRALPLLKSLADFDKLDGKMQAKIGVNARGASQRAMVSSLDGTVFVNFAGGSIQGINVAKMIRALTSSTLSGWQESSEQNTDLEQLSASFRLEKGKATSSDFALVGPLVRMTGGGTVDLGSKSLAFRVEPKLVMSIEGQGRSSNHVGLGIPVVVVEGPWAAPQIYPDVAGMLDNPDAAYARLNEMGKGLFGGNGTRSNGLGGSLGETLGTLIHQGLSRNQGTSVPRSIPPISAPEQSSQATPPADSEAMNGILRDLFNR